MEYDEQISRQPPDSLSLDAFSPIKTQSLSQAILERLVNLLRTGEIAPGQKIPSEKELMGRFAVGRSSIREALHALVAMGFLESRAGRGYFATQAHGQESHEYLIRLATSEQDYCHVVEARHELEVAIARLAVERATPSDFAALENTHQSIVHAFNRGDDIRPLMSLFHLAIAEMTHNPVFVQLLGALIPSWKASAERKSITDEQHLKLHQLLLDSLKKKDVERMVQIMNEYYVLVE